MTQIQMLKMLDQIIAEQEEKIKTFKEMLNNASDNNLAAHCLERGISIRKPFVNRLALILAKKRELKYDELYVARQNISQFTTSEIAELEAWLQKFWPGMGERV